MWKKTMMLMLSALCVSSMAAGVDQIFNELDKKSEQFKTMQYRTVYYDGDGKKVPASESSTKMMRTPEQVLIHHETDVSMNGQQLKVEALITPTKTYMRKTINGAVSYDQNPTRNGIYGNMVCHGMVLNDNSHFDYKVLPDAKEEGMDMWVVQGTVKDKSRNPAVPARIIWKFDKKSGLNVRTEGYNANGTQILSGRVYDIRVDDNIDKALFDIARFSPKK